MSSDITIVGTGSNSGIEAQVDASHKAIRVTSRPIEHQVGPDGLNGGHYSIAGITGTIAAGIADLSQVFQILWLSEAKIFILKRLTVQCATLAGFAATSLGAPLEFILGHGATANGSGGATLTPTSVSNKMRTGMATSSFRTAGEIRIATTGALGAATNQTLEGNPISNCMGASNQTLVQTTQMDLWRQVDNGTHPIILQSGDTGVIRVKTPAGTGTWSMAVWMEWVEAQSY